jgi:hypothetical protein
VSSRDLTAAAQISKPTSGAASRPADLGGIGHTAGLEIYAARNGLRVIVTSSRARVRHAATKNNFVHRGLVLFETKDWTRPRFVHPAGALSHAPLQPLTFFRFILLRLAVRRSLTVKG